jgi:hypothetical protein
LLVARNDAGPDEPMMIFRNPLSDLTPSGERLARLARLYAVVCVPLQFLVLLVLGWPTADGVHDVAGATLGHDLSQIWVAGRTALSGHADDVYQIASHHRRLVEMLGPDAALFAWHYPPVFFLVAALLAMVPLSVAALAWSCASVLLVASTLRAILGNWRPVIVGLAFPSVFECLGYGQNSLLTASLLGFGFMAMDRRPYLAGMVFGLLCYKPQLAGLAPLMMVVSGRWRVVAASVMTVAGAVVLSGALFGWQTWFAFLQSLAKTNTVIFQEAWGSLALNSSAFGAVRILGGAVPLGWMVQIGVAAFALSVTLRMWSRDGSQALRNAAALAAIPLVSPYVPVYDLAVLIPAGAFFFKAAQERGGLEPAQRLVILGLSALALDPRDVTSIAHVPCGFVLAAGAFVLIVTADRSRQTRTDAAAQDHFVTRAPIDGRGTLHNIAGR